MKIQRPATAHTLSITDIRPDDRPVLTAFCRSPLGKQGEGWSEMRGRLRIHGADALGRLTAAVEPLRALGYDVSGLKSQLATLAQPQARRAG